jgi:SpoVK/Ycf46/Vps4 family AAA+-type ATPase
MAALDALPAWARELSEKYYGQTLAMFVLHGNVRDLAGLRGEAPEDNPKPAGAGASEPRAKAPPEFLPLGKFLRTGLFPNRDLVITYDRGSGLSFADPEMQKDFRRAIEGYDQFHGSNFAAGLPRNPDGVLSILDNYLRLRIADGKKIALILDFAETLAPAGDNSSLSAEDRNALVTLKRWAQHPVFLAADITICLIAENLAELNPGLVQNPGVAAIHIPLPDESERLEYIRGAGPLAAQDDVTPELLANLTAGLKRVQIQNLMAQARQNQRPLTMKFLAGRKKDMIEAESGGFLEFVQSRFNLEMVAGNDAAKSKLKDAAAALRAGKTDVLPMGYVICGPVGTGKTFLTTCFAGEVGIPAVTLKNFRSMWQGVTEANLERVLSLLKAMSPIAVIVDEADAQLGTRSSSGDSGVGNRVFAQIAAFMGNTELRGKVIWFLLTCRPDLLPVDLKRQGRAEEHIALFYPDTLDERRALLRAMQKKCAVTLAPEVEQYFTDHSSGLSGADIEAVLARARMKCALRSAGLAAAGGAPSAASPASVTLDPPRSAGGAAAGAAPPTAAPASAALPDPGGVSAEDVQSVLDDFVPPSYPSEIELQNLVAVLECTSRSLLPERYRKANRGELIERLNQLGALAADAS